MYTLRPEKKKSNVFVRILAVVGAMALAIFGCVIALLISPLSNIASAPVSHDVVYKVRTNRDSSVYPSCYWFDVTYEMTGGTSQNNAAICDGAKTVEVDRFVGYSGDFVYLSVQNDKYLARIACEIYIDGKLESRTFSNGQYVIASCSGRVP